MKCPFCNGRGGFPAGGDLTGPQDAEGCSWCRSSGYLNGLELAKYYTEIKNIETEGTEKTAKQQIFVFGSNLAGRHGRGSAYAAKRQWGAKRGVGVGRTGNAYAIPTKDERLKVLSLGKIGKYIQAFIDYAKLHPELEFLVVKIGCGLAGYREEDVAPLFAGAPTNCKLPKGWRNETI